MYPPGLLNLALLGRSPMLWGGQPPMFPGFPGQPGGNFGAPQPHPGGGMFPGMWGGHPLMGGGGQIDLGALGGNMGGNPMPRPGGPMQFPVGPRNY